MRQERKYELRNSQRADLEGDNDWTVKKRLIIVVVIVSIRASKAQWQQLCHLGFQHFCY